MSNPGDSAADAPFQRRCNDPQGNSYFVQVTPVFGFAGPVVLSTDAGLPAPSGLLGAVQSLLRRVQPAKDYEGACVVVYPDGAEDPVFLESKATMQQARDLATSVIAQIEGGVFEPRLPG